MLEPGELLATARFLSGSASSPAPTDAHLRRAVSSAYYALFHTVLRAAAERFMGQVPQAPGYSLLYRSFDHQHMSRMCEELQRSTLRTKYRAALHCNAVSKDMQEFADAFPRLQSARHDADYDPVASFLPTDVAAAIVAAEFAIDAFNRAPPAEQADVFALLMVGARG